MAPSFSGTRYPFLQGDHPIDFQFDGTTPFIPPATLHPAPFSHLQMVFSLSEATSLYPKYTRQQSRKAWRNRPRRALPRSPGENQTGPPSKKQRTSLCFLNDLVRFSFSPTHSALIDFKRSPAPPEKRRKRLPGGASASSSLRRKQTPEEDCKNSRDMVHIKDRPIAVQ